MRKILLFIVVLFSFVACNLDKLEPAQTKAFMKLFGDTGDTEGVDLLKLDDGYLLLGNNKNEEIKTAILIKTDLNGNQVWSNSFESVSGSALAKTDNSYFIVGDSINLSSPLTTRMSLIKTDLNGENHVYASLGMTDVPYHGTGITVSNIGEIVVCGYINGLTSGTDTTYVYGYSDLLVPTWSAVQKWEKNSSNTLTSSRTLLENEYGDFVWTSVYYDGSTNKIEAILVSRDNPVTPNVVPLLNNEQSIDNTLGDFNSTIYGGILAQTVSNGGNTQIALSLFDSLSEKKSELISKVGINLTAGTVMEASDGDIVVLGSINKRSDDPSTDPRSDLDFYITKVGDNGAVSSISGFTNIIGGTGDETGAAIVQADDRGFVFLGTMKNTNDVNFMVLVKVDVKGELIN